MDNETKFERRQGMILLVTRDRYEILADGRRIYAKLKKASYFHNNQEMEFPTVGDKVGFLYNTSGDSLIIRTEKRKSCFKRLNMSPGMQDQAVAANFDYVFIVQSLNHDINMVKLERYLTLAWQSGGIPVIILSKADLLEDVSEVVQRVEETAPEVDIIALSVKNSMGMEPLYKYLQKDKMVVLLGSSGVGKSSLVNALIGEELMLTGNIREADSQGRHTTTFKQAFVLDNGAVIIDTPGIREIQVSDALEGMSIVYDDIKALIADCKFSNCSHTKEKGCAIVKALQDGTLSQKRWKTYTTMLREERYAKEREGILAKRKKGNKKNGCRKRKEQNHENTDIRNRETYFASVHGIRCRDNI